MPPRAPIEKCMTKGPPMNERRGLDDPAHAAFAWGRYRRILGWMALVSVACAGAAVWLLWRWIGPLPIHVAIATALGVGLSILMAAALMGLVFMSSGTGHDEMVDEVERDTLPPRWR
jgi:hypothetical protein